MNNEIKNLKNEKEELILMKIEYEKEKNVIKNYYIMKDEYEKGKKEIINLKEKYDNQIISERKNYDDTIKQIKEKSENELNEQKKNYEKIIKEKSDKDNREIKELKDKISYQEKSIQIYKNENESYKNEISKKSDMFKNLKEIYENLISKVKEQENKLQKYENPKNKSLLMDSLIGNSENEKNIEENNKNNNNNNENNIIKQYSSFNKFSFTKEILVDYILCLYLSENGITLQNIISNIMGNLNLFLSNSFKDDIDEDTFNNYTNFPNKLIEQELIEDIFFLCFDKLITYYIMCYYFF
jgi:chromosome segregation ATPase